MKETQNIIMMKKLLSLLLLLPLLSLVGCSDDDDFPQVDVTVSFDNVSAAKNGTIYVVEGNPLKIESVEVKSLTGKPAALTSMDYYLDGLFIGVSPIAPYDATISASALPVGRHLLQLNTMILQEDKSVLTSYLTFTVQVVPELPEGAEPLGPYKSTFRCDVK